MNILKKDQELIDEGFLYLDDKGQIVYNNEYEFYCVIYTCDSFRSFSLHKLPKPRKAKSIRKFQNQRECSSDSSLRKSRFTSNIFPFRCNE